MLKTDLHIDLKVTSAQVQLIRQLLYYDLFKYPLVKEEFLSKITEVELADLLTSGMLRQEDGYYSTELSKKKIDDRKAGNKLCESWVQKAYRRAKFIAQFPFVRGVYISGSMSKGFMSSDGDVDFFLITEPGRLWLSRTILIAFKKLFLLNSRKFFCMNYFIDTDHLEIEEKNVFTAVELSTLIPVCDMGYHDRFGKLNGWIDKEFKGARLRPALNKTNKTAIKKFLEFFLSGWIGKNLDALFFRITLKVWHKKFNAFTEDEFALALKSRKYISKHHPQNFQRQVLLGFQQKVEEFEKKHGISLSA